MPPLLQRDYLIEQIAQFVRAIIAALRAAHELHDESACEGIEAAVADLVALPADTALALSPESLAQMMGLSGLGYTTASYVCYALDRLADVYDDMGRADAAEARRAQAEAVAARFGVDLLEVPQEFDAADRELFGQTPADEA